MKIAQIAPLTRACPPKLYGGTERVVSYLTEELVRQGHEVTLFASGDSITAARLVADCARGAAAGCRRSAIHCRYHIMHARAGAAAGRRTSTSCTSTSTSCNFPLLRTLRTPSGDHPARPPGSCPSSGRSIAPSPISRWSRSRTSSALPIAAGALGRHRPPRACRATCSASHQPRAEPYLAFLGRISPEKRPDRAIEIATRAGLPLRIAAKIDAADARYWRDRRSSRSCRRNPLVEFVGEIGEAEKAAFLGGAARAALPDRLARAVRPGDDRGDGLRHAGDRLRPRLGARGASTTASPACSSTASTKPSPRSRGGGDARPRGRAARRSRRVSPSARMADDYLQVYGRLCGRGRSPREALPLAA